MTGTTLNLEHQKTTFVQQNGRQNVLLLLFTEFYQNVLKYRKSPTMALFRPFVFVTLLSMTQMSSSFIGVNRFRTSHGLDLRGMFQFSAHISHQLLALASIFAPV
jgi:hypothetical protein